jgi:hypothetical protein
MAELVENNDRQTTAASLLIDLFREKPEFLKLLSSYVAETQELENVLFDLLQAFWIDTAVGVQLDAIGEIVGAAREGLDDERYRVRVRVRILLNLTNGTPNEILRIVNMLIEGGAAYGTYTPIYPASFNIELHGDLTEAQIEEAARAVIEATPAGVLSNFIY